MTPNKTTRRSGTPRHQRTTAVLAAISAYAVVSAGILWLFDGLPTVIRIPLALPVLLLIPGYAVLAALFPGSWRTAPEGAVDESAPQDRTRTGFSFLERGILAIVASIAVVPMVALATTAVAGVDVGSILAGVAGVTVIASGISIVRSPATETMETRRSEGQRIGDRPILDDGGDRVLTDNVTRLAIALTVVLLVASAAVAFTGSTDDALMTEFYVVDETGGDAATASQEEAVYDLRIKHHGDESQRYTVVVLGQDDVSGSGTSTGSWTELDRTSLVVGSDETAAETYRATGSELSGRFTLRFLLYTGDAPPNPDSDTAHRTLELSVNSTAG